MQVVLDSGHMTDAAGRSAARFPEASVGRVRNEIARQLERWNVGSGDMASLVAANHVSMYTIDPTLRIRPISSKNRLLKTWGPSAIRGTNELAYGRPPRPARHRTTGVTSRATDQ